MLFGGKRGLVVNSRDVCARPYRAVVTLRAHNGKALRSLPLLRNGKCGGHGKKRHGHHKRRRRGDGHGKRHRGATR